MSPVNLSYEQTLLPFPDLPNTVHGIISDNPPKVQCDGCGLIVTGPPGKMNMTIVLSHITFSFRDGYQQRLCRECRAGHD